MGFPEMVAKDRRLVILKILAESDQYSTNEHLLKAGLHGFGHNVGTDLLHTELAWLQEQRLVQIDEIGGVQIPKLTGRGLDVSTGATVVPGVKRPEPE